MDNLTKRLLEKICIPHKTVENNIKIEGEDAHIFASSLGFRKPKTRVSHERTVLENLAELAGFPLREKAPTSIGARMGRPEKAKRREMKPLVHALFPAGLAGGAQRDLTEAVKKGVVKVETVKRRCPVCGMWTFGIKCLVCEAETMVERFCPMCGRSFSKESLCPLVRFRQKVLECRL